TSHIGLICTVSTTFHTPFHAARMLASLDHISHGRIGWNVVTSMFDAEARNHSMKRMPTSAQRYARAAEFIDVASGLWDSWDDDAVVAQRQADFADPAKIHPVNHIGEYFQVAGPLNIPRGPQGRPVLFQAGLSGSVRALASRIAEGTYSFAHYWPTGHKAQADETRAI